MSASLEGGRLTRVAHRCWSRAELGHLGLPINPCIRYKDQNLSINCAKLLKHTLTLSRREHYHDDIFWDTAGRGPYEPKPRTVFYRSWATSVRAIAEKRDTATQHSSRQHSKQYSNNNTPMARQPKSKLIFIHTRCNIDREKNGPLRPKGGSAIFEFGI